MEQGIIERALLAYGLTPTELFAVQKGYRNQSYAAKLSDGQIVNFIVYKNEPRILQTIKRTNAVGAFAAAQGYPARRPADTRILKMASGNAVRYGSLYNYLPGQTIPWEAYTMEHLKVLGTALSDLHGALNAYGGELADTAQLQQQLNARIHAYFVEPGVVKALSGKLYLHIIRDDFSSVLQVLHKVPSKQALHMDFVRGNVLFSGKQLTGVLDFEKTSRGHPVFDIARTLAFLLVDCKYKPEQKIRKYFLASGYNKRGVSYYQPLIYKGQPVLEELIDFFLLHDLYKFLRHNPYESLPANEHFVRTSQLLQKRGIIGYNKNS